MPRQLEIYYQYIRNIRKSNDSLEGVAIARTPTRRLTVTCSSKVKYIPAFTRGMAQQQYSLVFMMRGRMKRSSCRACPLSLVNGGVIM